MSNIPPITDAYIDEIIKAPDAYNPSLNKTQGVKLRELIKKLRDYFTQEMQPGLNGQNLISVTYNELVNLVNTSTLIPGQNYLLIDFVSTFNMYEVTYNNGGYSVSYTDEIYNGTIEPIIINAVKTNLLSSIAYSTIYSSHELIYTTDNLLGGVFASTKGTILTRVEKEFNNRANFDWVSLKYTNENNAIVPAIYFGDQYYNRAINCSICVTDQYGLLKMIIIKSISGCVNVKMNQNSGSCIIGSLYDTDVRSSRLDAYNVNIADSKIKNLSLIYGDINNQQIYISNLNMMNNSANVNYNSNWALLQQAAQKNIIDVYSQAYIQYINEQGQFITQLLT